MDHLPFAFCDSVAALQSLLPLVEHPVANKTWLAAINENKENRLNVSLNIGFYDGDWSYLLECQTEPPFSWLDLTFEHLQNLNKKYLRIWQISVNGGSGYKRSSFEEILTVAKLTIPYVSMSYLNLREVDQFEQDKLLQLLSFYSNSTISAIYTRGNIRPICDFLKELLHSSEILHDVWIHDASISDAFQAKVEEFALTKPFTYLVFEPQDSKLSWAFFERLFEKSIESDWNIGLHSDKFDFNFIDLKEFKTELQICPEDQANAFHWKREDGVVVHVQNIVFEDGTADTMLVKFCN